MANKISKRELKLLRSKEIQTGDHYLAWQTI
jgi:hypothetical protein